MSIGVRVLKLFSHRGLGFWNEGRSSTSHGPTIQLDQLIDRNLDDAHVRDICSVGKKMQRTLLEKYNGKLIFVKSLPSSALKNTGNNLQLSNRFLKKMKPSVIKKIQVCPLAQDAF